MRNRPESPQTATTKPSREGVWDWLAALISSVLLWAAFPPIGCWPLAWVAPLGWLRLISRPHWRAPRPYRLLYVAGCVHWLLLIHWIRLPHWSASFGWLALSAYLAAYIPLFVALSRLLIHRWGLSIVWAAPIVWTGLEFARGRLLTGFSLSLLGHTQLAWLPLIQISDVIGAYGVSFVVMMTAACLERMLPCPERRRALFLPPLTACLAIGGYLYYGQVRLDDATLGDLLSEPTYKIALLQGSLDTQFDGDVTRVEQAFLDYQKLAEDAVASCPDVDLLIWPESMFSGSESMVTYEEPVVVPENWEGSKAELRERLELLGQRVRQRMAWSAQRVDKPMIVGMAWDHFVAGQWQRYNSAVLLNAEGAIVDRYDKRHRVMFGEYVPLGNWFPWLYRLTPMQGGLTPGSEPRTFKVNVLRLAPAVCFENTVPHLIRRHVKELTQRDQAPDILVTITNDGWFWGSSLLDAHLASAVFRAVELRRPHVIAANTGFSASIDGDGRIQAQGPRRAPAVVMAEVQRDGRRSVYLAGGDWFAGGCLFISLIALLPRRKPS